MRQYVSTHLHTDESQHRSSRGQNDIVFAMNPAGCCHCRRGRVCLSGAILCIVGEGKFTDDLVSHVTRKDLQTTLSLEGERLRERERAKKIWSGLGKANIIKACVHGYEIRLHLKASPHDFLKL